MPVMAAGVSLVAAGVIAATQTAPSLPDAAIPAVQLTSGETTSDTLTGLLNTATTDYTDAYNVAAGMFTDGAVPAGSTSDFGLIAAQAQNLSQSMVQITATYRGTRPPSIRRPGRCRACSTSSGSSRSTSKRPRSVERC